MAKNILDLVLVRCSLFYVVVLFVRLLICHFVFVMSDAMHLGR
jgi:hypothetical protein